MHPFVRNLITEWRRLEMPFADAAVVVAVSGGGDSVSLLLAMHELRKAKKLDLRLVAAHFDHGLRGAESDADAEFVKQLTSKLGIEFAIGHAKVERKGNLEQNARTARYDFLHSTAKNLGAFAVVTGHTINDQAETFLMNLIRGSGVEGLSGMRSVRQMQVDESRSRGIDEVDDEQIAPLPPLSRGPLLLIRPLLTWAKRGDTEAFCHDLRVEYRYDTMNEDTAFKRVRIRKILLPLLEDMNPKIIETLAATAGLMQTETANREERNQIEHRDELMIAELKTLPPLEFYGRIRTWLQIHRGTKRQLQLKHMTAIERLVHSEKSGRIAEIPGGQVIKSAGRLRYEQNKVEN